MRALTFSLVVGFCVACDTGDPGNVSTSTAGAPPSANGGSDGNGGTGGTGLLPGIAGLGNGLAGSLTGGNDGPDGGSLPLGGATGGPSGGGSNSGGSTSGNPPLRFYDYIRSNRYSKLVFEIDSVEGQEPHSAIQTRIPERFAELLDKPGGVEVIFDDTLPTHGSDFAWSNADLDQITRSSFDGDPDSDTVAIHITYLDGHSGGDGDNGVILGVAWGWLQVVMYKETIENSCGGLGLIGALNERACAEAEFAILSHEIGHVLGLVDNGLPMVDDHRDPETEHGAHDFDQNCVMYWAYEGQGLFDQIGARLLAGNDDSLPFCQHCLDDLAAAQ
jgi:hypothetical protein